MGQATKEEDYDLQRAWENACDAFVKTTSEDLKKKPKYSPSEVLDQIRAKQEQDEEKNAKYKTAKDILSKTLDCINNLGTIAAQGASMVLGPTDMCMNAVSFLIQVGAKYKNIFTSLAELFSHISDFLDRFKIYFRMTDVDIALRRIINDLLICFVSICALSIKVLKGNKALIFLKVLAFSGDEGVAQKLGELANLVEREREMRGTLGYEVEKNIEKSVAAGRTETKEGIRALNSAVNEMAELEKKREASNVQAKQLEAIKKALDNPGDTYRTMYQTFIDKRVVGTGSWLLNHGSFEVWASRAPSSFRLLGLSGGEGYGKSFLVSAAIQDLKRKFPQTGEDFSRTSIAYHYFARGQSDRLGSPLGTALKSLAWQVANIDAVYRKELYAICGSLEDVENAVDLWWKLFTTSFKSDATIFLLFDGLEQLEEKQLQVLVQIFEQLSERYEEPTKERGSLCLRILVSGKPEVVQRMTDSCRNHSYTVDLASNNKEDIEKYVQDAVSGIDILRGTSNQVQELRNKIFTGLTKDAKGDFINVGLILKQIADKNRPAEILEVLKRFEDGEDRSDTIAREVEGLNKSLGQQDIRDLNELLVWVLCCCGLMNLGQLEAVLLLKNGEGGSSLRPLAETIKEQYSKIFAIEGEPDPVTKKIPLSTAVKIVSDSIEDYFRTLSASRENDRTSNAVNGGDVNESEVKIVRRFLESVCDPELFSKFQFEQFFESKLNNTTVKILVDLEGSNLKLATDCLEVICSDNKDFDPLLEYARLWFDHHLGEVDLSLMLPDKKTAVGTRLIKLFADEKAIARWWTKENFSTNRFRWLYSDDCADVILTWFKDSAVVKGLTEEQKQWIKDLTSNSNPAADILENIAKYLGVQLLTDPWWVNTEIIAFIDGFLSKLGARKDPEKVKRKTEDAETTELTIEDLDAVIDFATTSLGAEVLSYENTRNVARVYRNGFKHEKSIEWFTKASALQEDNWLCQWGLATAYGNQKNWLLAIEILGGTIKKVEDGTAKVDDPQQDLAEMKRELAQYNKESGDFEMARSIYEAILNEYTTDFDTAFEYFTFLSDNNQYDEIIRKLKDMKEKFDEKDSVDCWTSFFHSWAQYTGYHQLMALTAAYNDGQAFDLIKGGYETAIEAAKVKQRNRVIVPSENGDYVFSSIVGALSLYYATFLNRVQTDGGSTGTIISLLEDVYALGDADPYYYNPARYAAYTGQDLLAILYSIEARKHAPDSQEASDYIEKLRALNGKEQTDAGSNPSYYRSVGAGLGRYYAVVGKEKETMDSLRYEIKTGVDLLSDDDDSNDWYGFSTLGDIFIHCGYEEDALAAYSLITPTESDEKPDESKESKDEGKTDAAQEEAKLPSNGEPSHVYEEHHENNAETGTEDSPPDTKDGSSKPSDLPHEGDQTSTPEAESTSPPASEEKPSNESQKEEKKPGSEESTTPTTPALGGPLNLVCDGGCDKKWLYPSDMYYCKDCPNVIFDPECYKKLQGGESMKISTLIVCKKEHEFLHVPPYNAKKIEEIGKGNVKVGEKIMTVDDWIEGIRKKWGLKSAEKENVEGEGEKVVSE